MSCVRQWALDRSLQRWTVASNGWIMRTNRRRDGRNKEMVADDIYEDDTSPLAKYEAKELFQEAYEAQLAQNFDTAIELYRRSIETYPTRARSALTAAK